MKVNSAPDMRKLKPVKENKMITEWTPETIAMQRQRSAMAAMVDIKTFQSALDEIEACHKLLNNIIPAEDHPETCPKCHAPVVWCRCNGITIDQVVSDLEVIRKEYGNVKVQLQNDGNTMSYESFFIVPEQYDEDGTIANIRSWPY